MGAIAGLNQDAAELQRRIERFQAVRDGILTQVRQVIVGQDDVLDQILELHVEQSQSAEEIVARGFDEATVRRILRMVRVAEFKRKQAAPVLKVTSRAFGTGWRMPIVRGE